MEKYSQQESIIQNLKRENEELVRLLDQYEGQQMEMRSEAESSTGTEMVLASDGTMSQGGFSTQKKGKCIRGYVLSSTFITWIFIPTNFIHYARSCHY